MPYSLIASRHLPPTCHMPLRSTSRYRIQTEPSIDITPTSRGLLHHLQSPLHYIIIIIIISQSIDVGPGNLIRSDPSYWLALSGTCPVIAVSTGNTRTIVHSTAMKREGRKAV